MKKVLTVKELKEKLIGLDEDDVVYAYEGETTGIVVVSSTEKVSGSGIFEDIKHWKETKFIPTIEPEAPAISELEDNIL